MTLSTITRFLFAAAAVLTLPACGKDSSTPTTPTPTGPTISIVSGSSTRTTNAYSPNPMSVARGSSLTWTNNDNTAHTSTSDTGVWSSGTIAPGASFTTTLSTAGTFTYHCQLHPGMVGTINVQ